MVIRINEEPAGSANTTWTSNDIPYSESFENNVQHVLLRKSSAGRRGIMILSDDSDEQPRPGASILLRDIDPDTLPQITFNELPLPLDDPRRVYTSSVPGINLTHPHGYFEGGPSHDQSSDAFFHDFVARNNILNHTQMRDVVAKETQNYLQEARARMRSREEAIQHNSRIEKELKTLMDQREMEVKIETRMKDEANARRERREKKRSNRAAG